MQMSADRQSWGPAAATADSLEARHALLTDYLKSHRDLWEPRPFTVRRLPWEDAHPEVSAWLRGLPLDHAEQIEAQQELPAGAPGALREWADRAAALCLLEPWPVQALPGARALLGSHLNERKRLQVLAFCGAVLPWLPTGADTVVEWCAGKGHVGRIVARHTPLPVTSLERSAGLCATGNGLATAASVRQRLVAADVLAAATWEHLEPGTAVLALHACGILTSTLVREAARRRVRALALAPCCLHYLNRTAWYVPQSAAGRAAALPLSAQDLRLSTLDEVVASGRSRAERRRAEVFRLGFDLLVREASGRDEYTSPGHLPAVFFRRPFREFCQAVAALRGLPLPRNWNADLVEAAGTERFRCTQALSTLRAQFRRPLELWVELDRALCLQEAGYRVALGTFCARHVTPRNILLLASRTD